MASSLHRYLSEDHIRLDAFMSRIVNADGGIDMEAYEEFRKGILRHIGIEERILMPLVRKAGASIAELDQLHREHAAICALLVPAPTATEIEMIHEQLSHHNPLEELPGGLYDLAETLSGADLAEVEQLARAYPEVKVAPYTDSPLLRRTIAQLVREAEEGRRRLDEQARIMR